LQRIVSVSIVLPSVDCSFCKTANSVRLISHQHFSIAQENISSTIFPDDNNCKISHVAWNRNGRGVQLLHNRVTSLPCLGTRREKAEENNG
jgi:hypothetical protein